MAITVIGDAFIDVVVPIYGVKPGETYYRDVSVACGGTANVAIQVAKLGEKVKFVGKVGNDALGRYFVESLERNKVEALILYDENPTGLCVSLVYEDGERSMVASRGANDNWTRNGVNAYLAQVVKSGFTYFLVIDLASSRFITRTSTKSLIIIIKESFMMFGAPGLNQTPQSL